MTSAIVPIFLFSILNTFFFTSSLLAQNAVEPGQFIVEPPTLTNLGFEWYLTGDANRNVTVQEKKTRGILRKKRIPARCARMVVTFTTAHVGQAGVKV
ncbi:MAG: hypothetical protein RIG62_30330 [Cyclobacteriaceae bacterium]